MKNIFKYLVLLALISSCGSKNEKKTDGFTVDRTKTEETKTQTKQEIPVDLTNKGVGPIKEMAFAPTIDTDLAAKGESTFNALCVACHQTNQRMIGPAMAGIYERRSPEWVMNMILNPDGMLKADPIAKALLKEYNNAIMLNQNLTEDEARAIAEYLRAL